MGYLYVLAAAVLWGTLGIWARLAYEGNARPNDVVFFRALIAFLVALWAVRGKGDLLRAARSRALLLAAYGTVSVGLFYLSYFWAVRLLPVAVAAVLLYTAPVFVALMARLFLGEALTAPRLVALVVALAGVALISGLGGGTGAAAGPGADGGGGPAPAVPPLGLLAGLLAGFTYATYTIFGKIAVRDLDPDAVVVYTLGVGSAILFLALPPQRLLALDLAPAVWAVLVVVGVGPTYLAYRLYTHGLRLIPASTAAIVAMVEPVVAAVLGWLLLREALTASQVAGGLLVLLGAVLARERPARRGAAGSWLPGAGTRREREKNHGYSGERRG